MEPAQPPGHRCRGRAAGPSLLRVEQECRMEEGMLRWCCTMAVCPSLAPFPGSLLDDDVVSLGAPFAAHALRTTAGSLHRIIGAAVLAASLPTGACAHTIERSGANPASCVYSQIPRISPALVVLRAYRKQTCTCRSYPWHAIACVHVQHWARGKIVLTI